MWVYSWEVFMWETIGVVKTRDILASRTVFGIKQISKVLYRV